VDEEESASDGIDEGVEESEDDGEDEEGEEGDNRAGNKRSRSRKRKVRTTSSRPAKNRKTQSARSLAAAKAKSKARLKARLKSRPAAGDDTFVSVPVHLLPKDPFERALHLLHVGATPDSLPNRETEYLEVLSRVQEGVESGNGGCLCEFGEMCGITMT
jgi:origin recognition complex subunit 1